MGAFARTSDNRLTVKDKIPFLSEERLLLGLLRES